MFKALAVFVAISLILAGCLNQPGDKKTNQTPSTTYVPNYTAQNTTVQTAISNASSQTSGQQNISTAACNCTPTQYCTYNRTCREGLQSIPGNPQHKNHALDVAVYVDSRSNYTGLTDEKIMQVMETVKRLFRNKTGVDIIVRSEIERESLGKLILVNAPEVIVVFSNQDNAGIYWGYSFTSDQEHNPSYCNEIELATGAQKSVGIAVVNWHHWYSRCGYERQNGALVRTSQTPNSGECRNNRTDTCTLRQDGVYYQCASTLEYPYSNLDYFTAATVIHEITHTLDRESYGHFGEVPGCQEERDKYAKWGDFILASEENFGMCPKTFDLIKTHFKGCS